MSSGKVKASKVKVYPASDNTTGLDGHFHVYTFDVFNRAFLPGKTFETIERAVAYQRHEQERLYAEQEAEPELFDLPFISTDPELLDHVQRNPDYRGHLTKELVLDARERGRHRG